MSDAPPSMRYYRLHYHDGREETLAAYGYNEAGDRIVFHGTPDGSDHSAWVSRTLLVMIAEEDGAAVAEAPRKPPGPKRVRRGA